MGVNRDATAVREASAGYDFQAATPAVPVGYKQTEVGVIPEDWECIEISRLLSDISMGPFGSDIKVSNFVKEGVPVLDGFNVRTERLLDDFSKFVTESKAKSLKKAVAHRGDVVITHRGTIGQVSFIPYDSEFKEYVISQSQFRARFNSSVLPQWVTIYFLSERGSKRLLEGKGHTGVPAIAQPTTTFRKLKLPVPSSEEQRAIATALSDVDALLEGLDRLIAKKRDLKQAAMQQLLTGQTRLPGFEGEWEVKRLGEIAHIKTGSRNNEDKVDDGDYPFFVRSEFVERINSYSHDCEAILVPGEGRIGDIFHYIQGRFDVHQRVYAITQFAQGVSAKFVHLYMSMNFGAWAMQNTVKATVDSLRLPTFQTFELTLPPTIEEQTAIATVLSDMDTELEALEQRRAKTTALKQAMMQELLTGRVRLFETKSEESADD